MISNLKYNINSKDFDNTSNSIGLNYIICSTPRSGSTLLAEGLKSTGIAGMPHEYFNVDHKSDYFKRWNFNSNQEYVDLLKKNRVSDNGVFGLKMHFNQFKTQFNVSDLNDVFRNLKFIFITRSDKVAQAISLEIAVQTNKWSSEFNRENKAEFNYNNIKKKIYDIKKQESDWLNYFKKFNIQPLIVNYEDLEESYEDSIARVLEFLDLKYHKKIPPMQIKKQRGFKNYFWKKRYRFFNLIKS